MDSTSIDPMMEAKDIIQEHIYAFILGAIAKPETERDLYKMMAEECAFILLERRLEGKYTPLQFNAVRNAIASLLSDVCVSE